MRQAGLGARRPRGSVLATGTALFAGVFLALVGVFHVLTGLSAIISKGLFVITPNYLFAFNLTAWGWIHLLFGLLVTAVGFGVLVGQVWAYTAAIVMAALSAVVNFLFIPYYPVWSLLITALDVLVIWALATRVRAVGD
jgi:hypothetical protein